MNLRPLTLEEEKVAQAITNAAIVVHKELGPGLLEKVYETCMAHLLSEFNHTVKQDAEVPIIFKGKSIDAGLKVNLMIDGLAIVEIKAADENHEIWERQMTSFLKLTGIKTGYIINFNNTNLMRNGFKRFVL